MLNDDEYDYKPIDFTPDAVFKSQLLCKLGFCSYEFMRVQKEKGIDNPAVSFVYNNINAKFNGVIKSLKDNGLIKYYDFLEVIDLASGEVREPTLDEEMTILECEDTAIFNCFKLIAQYHNPTIPQKNKAISVIVMHRMFSKYLEFKSDEIKKRLNIQVRKRVKYSVIQEPIKKIDFSEIEKDETLRDDYGVLKWELVRRELNKRVNQSLLKSLEKKMHHEDPKKRFSDESAREIKELIDLNYIPLTVYDNDDDDYTMIDDYEDYTMI